LTPAQYLDLRTIILDWMQLTTTVSSFKKCQNNAGHYRLSTQAAQKLAEKVKFAGITFKVLVQVSPT
jgi:hypothetical protein